MRFVTCLLLSVCALASCPALAQWNKIAFEGKITTQTCEAKINGVDAPVIKLPEVRDKVFDNNSSSAGLKTFTLGLGNCSHAEDGVQKVRVFFHIDPGQITTTAGGHLRNTIDKNKGGASGVALQLTRDDAGTKPIPLPQSPNANAVSLDLDMNLKDGTATHAFGVKYVRDPVYPLYPGTFSASAKWAIVYL